MKKGVIVILFLFLQAVILSASDYSVGTLLSHTGEVEIDAFGKGFFRKPARDQEKLYRNSIVKTGPAGSAEVEILGKILSIPSGAHFNVASIVELEAKRQNLDWFSPMMELFDRVTDLLYLEQEDVDLVSRGEDLDSLMSSIMTYEEDGEQEEIDFFVELSFLQSRDIGYSEGERKYKMGICYFKTANYADAERFFHEALELKEADAYYGESLLLMAGVSNYLLGRYKKAIEYFNLYMTQNSEDVMLPFASWLMINSLRNTGEEDRASALEKSVPVLDGILPETERP